MTVAIALVLLVVSAWVFRGDALVGEPEGTRGARRSAAQSQKTRSTTVRARRVALR